MRLVRTASVALMTDLLELEDDDGQRTEIARPTAGYHSGSGYSSHLDEVYRWRARLHVGPVVMVEAWIARVDGERCEVSWYGRDDAGVFVRLAVPPELGDAAVVGEIEGA